jgi:quaternary ammonium compound-resistance protein SugE
MPELVADRPAPTEPRPTPAEAEAGADAQGPVTGGPGAVTPDRTPFLVGWGALWAAIALNVSQVFLLDGSDGLSEPALLPVVAAGFLAELWLFGRAVRCLSPVIAYAAYGTTPAVVTVLSVALFGEAPTVAKLAGVGAVTAGVVLLATEGTPTPRATCAADLAPENLTDPQQPRPDPTGNGPALRKDKT